MIENGMNWYKIVLSPSKMHLWVIIYNLAPLLSDVAYLWLDKFHKISSATLLFLSWGKSQSVFIPFKSQQEWCVHCYHFQWAIYPLTNLWVWYCTIWHGGQCLKLHKWEIYFPTTKGLHKGDMTRNRRWFDIGIDQWKVRLLWLGRWRDMYFCLQLQWPRFNL